MTNGRERVSAAVILIVFLIAAVFIYLIMLPPNVTYSLIYGNFSNSNNSNSTQAPTGSFYSPVNSYVGSNPNIQNFSYPLGTFGVSYSTQNSTLSSSSPFKLTSSIFGASSYNIGFNGSSSDKYFVSINLGKVSGSPNLKISLNGNYFYSTIPVSGENITLPIVNASNGKNTLSIYNYLNGFAFTQSISFSNVSVTQVHEVSGSYTVSTTVATFDGLGNFYLDFTPIGHGNLTVLVNSEDITSIASGSDYPVSAKLPTSVVNSAVSSANLSADFSTKFMTSGSNSTYDIANANIVYSMPIIAPQDATIPYSITKISGQYTLTFYISTIVNNGDLVFSFYPSGNSFTIQSSNLGTGINELVVPASALSGQISNGNYTGSISVSSTGLMALKYLDIKTTS